jgi:hypothetical protein
MLSPAGEAVARLPPIVARVRICGDATGAGGLDQWAELGQLTGNPRKGHGGAEKDRSVVATPRFQVVDPREVEERRRADPARVDVEHEVGAAGHGNGFRMLALDRERVVERTGCVGGRHAVAPTTAKASIIASTSSPSG